MSFLASLPVVEDVPPCTVEHRVDLALISKAVIAVPRLSKMSLVRRLSLYQVLVLLVVLGAFSLALSSLITRLIEERAEDNLKQQVSLLVGMISTYHSALAENANVLLGVFRASFPGEFSLDTETKIRVGDRQVPLLKSGSTIMDGDTGIVDRFHQTTQATCSVFVRSGDDFIRIASSVKDDKGNRIIGSLMERTHPAYAQLIQGGTYTGKASIAGRDYMSSYSPVKDAQGRVVAVVGILVDFTAGLQKLSEQIVKIKIGKTGYIYAMDAKPGPEQGTLRIHPTLAGKNVIHSKDAHGVEFFRDMIERRQV
jgi:hypothetical protein